MTHPRRDVLADLAADLTVDDATRAHVGGCRECAETVALFAGAGDLLGDLPTESMPDEVADRLQAVLDIEVARRRAGTTKAELDAESAAAAARTALGSFGANPIGDKQIGPKRNSRLSSR